MLFTLYFSVPILANANNHSDFDTYGIKNYEVISSQMEVIEEFERSTLSTDWSTLPSQSNIELNKEWTITFSGGTVSLDKIAGIVIERNGVFIPVRVRLFPAANQAIITPQENYLAGENYTVRAFLENGLRYKMSFSTKAELTTNAQLGNTPGNISNYGLAAEHNGWIYYRNTNDNGYLYRIKSDGTESALIVKHSVSNINVVGGWIYYLIGNSNSDIYRIRLDGSDNTRIRSGYYSRLIVTSDSLYSESSSPRIDKYSLDGKINNLIKSSSYMPLISNQILISVNYFDNKLEIYNMDTQKNIYKSSERVRALNLVDNWIYYINNDDYHIYKIDIEGKNKQKLNDDWSTHLNVYGSWMYYVNDEDQTLYRMKTDGTSRQQLVDSKATLINVTSEWIFYIDPTNSKLYKMKHNGSNWQEVK